MNNIILDRSISDYTPRWYFAILLDNKEEILSDDNRPDTQESFWLRLKKYCAIEQLSIVQIQMRFSVITHIVPEGLGYWFSYGAMARWGENKTYNQWIWGTLKEDGNVYIDKWIVPEFIIFESEIRPLSKCLENIIINPEHADKFKVLISSFQ